VSQVRFISFPGNQVPSVSGETLFKSLPWVTVKPVRLPPEQEREVLQWVTETARRWVRGAA
jgi:hypothetical protein